MTHAQFDEILHAGWQQYHSIVDTDDADLSAFKAAGRKMMTYHGLVRNLPPFYVKDYKLTDLSPLRVIR
jgi:hypothetical protein